MPNPSLKIIELLDQNKINYEITEHVPVFTSEEAARVRGVDDDSGAKSMLLKHKDGYILIVLPGGRKLDSKKLRRLGIKESTFATADEVMAQMGCKIGACYPFGNIANLKTIVDHKLTDLEYIYLNPGVNDKSMKLLTADYIKIAKPEVADISK